MSGPAEFRAALASGDVRLVRKAAAITFPHLPQPQSDEEAEVLMHVARTETESLPIEKRAWSHRWLCERGLPSHLPDGLRPSAERLYPVIAEGVLVAVMAQTEEMKPFAARLELAMSEAIEDAMSQATLDALANGVTDPAEILKLKLAARDKLVAAHREAEAAAAKG